MDFLTSFIHKVHPLKEESIELIKDIVVYKKLKKGTLLLQKGEPSKKFYAIKKGVIRSFYIDEKGKEYNRALYKEYSTTGCFYSLVNKTTVKSNFECLSDCEVIEGNYNEYIQLTRKHLDIALFNNKVTEIIYSRTEERAYDLSVLDATERYKRLQLKIPNIESLIPLYQIASYLNITNVQLSRIRKKIISR